MAGIEPPSPRWVTYAVIVLTILAPLLGGSTTLWAQATIMALTGLLFLIAPARRSLGAALSVLFLLIAAAPFTEFLPARLFAQPDWRATLVRFGVTLPSTWSPQPWLTLESACLLCLGLAWAYY